MPKTICIALAQVNPVVGALGENAKMIQNATIAALQQGANMIVFPELVLCGYPPEDLILKPKFISDCMAIAEKLAQQLPPQMACIIGTPWRNAAGQVQNVSAVMQDGRITHIIPKTKLPNYGVFDELRVFTPADEIPEPIEIQGIKFAIPICEDIWHADVCAVQAKMGAEIVLVPNGSPYWKGKEPERRAIAFQRVRETGLPMVYVNRTGGQDELVFDGASFVLNGDCATPVRLPEFEDAIVLTDWTHQDGQWVCTSQPSVLPAFTKEQSLYTACVVGLRDYVNRNSFKSVVLGLSGGIDSALCAAIAVDALGAERVHAVMMPYTYTAQDSLDDAAECAKNLGMSYEIIPIAPMVEAFETTLALQFTGTSRDLTEENLQSRVRGMLLMALSNKFGHMVVTTGNKSEMAVGYCTLYGDMNGGFNPIKDLYKTEVFAMCTYINAHGVIRIPVRILTKAPSAELRPDQKDQDSLPPYEVLDAILEGLVEQELSVDDLIHKGFAPETVRRVEQLLTRAEYKRRQAAPGVKLSRRNFGRDRRYPITNGYRSG